MAVLKDLIVHGRSKFVNGAQFNTINAESIGAEQGIFNKLIATTLDAKEATIDNLTAQNATVVGLLDVQGELHTNAWTNANIANIGGSFYISPTVEPTDGTTTISITRNSATSWTVSASGTFATDFIKSGTATSGVAWPANSLVLITGDVVVGNMVYPLGTLKGTLSSQVTATAATTSKTITITGVTDAQNNNSPSVLQELYELNGNANISNAIYKNGKISLYKLGSNPIGILLSSMGTNSNSIIDIYGGVSTNPTVRIGHLAGLPNVNGSAPTGWGIYTDNGYFSGVIVSTSGKIGGWKINSDSLASEDGKVGLNVSSTSGYAFWAGNATVASAPFSVKYDGTFKATAGTIGGWSIGTSSIYSGTNSKTSTATGTYLGTDAIRNYGSSTQYVHIEGGKITAKSVDLSGAITATSGGIGGFKIDSTSIRTNDVVITSNADNSIGLSSADFTRTINGTSRAGLRFAIGDKFGVTGDGIIYAGSAIISGTLSAGANSTIGPWTVTSTSIYKGNATHGTSGDGNMYFGNSGLSVSNKFKVDNAGNLTATSANITGTITATSGTFTGTIHATSGEFNGQITAGSGTIGRWLITSTALKTNSGSNSAGMGAESTYAFWAGNETPASAPFRVNYNGTLTASGATITGNITATQGFTVTSSVGGQTLASMTGSGIQLGPVTGTSHYNVFIDANGINLRYDSNILNKVDSTGMKVYSSDGKKFLQSGTNGLHVYNGSVTEVAVLGYANGTAESGMADAPYFTLGTRSGTIGNWSGCFGAGTASGYMSFIQGKGNTASNNYTMARGSGCTASGLRAFASGYNCTASGTDSIAMGSNCQATSSDSKALGYYCNSTYSDLFVVGKYNDPTSGDLFEVGDGSSSSRRNAFRVNGSGNAYVRNGLYIGGHASQVGDYKGSEVSTSATVASGTESETGCSVSLGIGVWVVGYAVSFVAGSGTRTCALYQGSTYYEYSRIRLPVATTGWTVLNGMMIINLTSAATINLYAGHAGVSSSQTYNASLRAVRIA